MDIVSFYLGGATLTMYQVALTSPDPQLNSDAREFFTRHMRILEKCMGAWPMPDMQRQVDSIRQAFSADVRKAFVLKPSFPYGSPSSSTHSSPPSQYRPEVARSGSMEQPGDTRMPHSQVSYISHPLTPMSPLDSSSDSGVQLMAMMTSSQPPPPVMQQAMPLQDAPSWNPSRIFEYVAHFFPFMVPKLT